MILCRQNAVVVGIVAIKNMQRIQNVRRIRRFVLEDEDFVVGVEGVGEFLLVGSGSEGGKRLGGEEVVV